MTIKVIQWATAAIGKTCLRQVIDHPDLELVGLFVYSDSKEGTDAGSLKGNAIRSSRSGYPGDSGGHEGAPWHSFAGHLCAIHAALVIAE